jgi:L-malate glycosyltransferase
MTGQRPIHQFLPSLLYGDAMSGHAIELMKLLRRWGHPSEIFVSYCDPRVAGLCRSYKAYEDDPDDLLIYQYGIGSGLTDFLRKRMPRTVLYYHNITPPRFFEDIDTDVSMLLTRGRDDLRHLAGEFRCAIACSWYNRQELLDLGFRDVAVIPILLDLPALERSADCPAGRRIWQQFTDDYVNILFVGRLSPNKRQEDLLYALRYYQNLIDPRARLLLAGSWSYFRYKARVEMLAEQMNLMRDVHFSGHLELEDGFAGYYRAATVFLCLSEHEGFGVPLVESLYFDVPVIAYASSAIPETLGGSGLLVTEKRYDVICELIHYLATDQAFRDRIIRRQRQRLADFDRTLIEKQIKDWVESI